MLLEVMEKIQTDLEAAGVRTVLDPAKASPPCAIVQPPSFVVRGIGGLVETTTTVSLIAQGRGDLATATTLTSLAELCIGVSNVTEGRPVGVTVGAIEYPGYELQIRITVRN
jgi:hypothetical protein